MLQFEISGWIIVVLCALMVGFSKTGVAGAGVLVVSLLACVMPAKESTGFLLPMLAMADIMAIIYWRRHVVWQRILKLLPWTGAGVVVGYFCMGEIPDKLFMPFLGVVVLILIAITVWRNWAEKRKKVIPTQWWVGGLTGISAGAVSMLSNAAGPIMTVYLLAMRLDKKQFVGTIACFFWILNLSKIPFSSKLDLISGQSLLTNLALLPCIVAGGILGIIFVHRIPQKSFNTVVMVLAGVAAVVLCIKPWF